jgi:hypothetical protein
MASYSGKILEDTVEGEKMLDSASRFESMHLPLPLANRLVHPELHWMEQIGRSATLDNIAEFWLACCYTYRAVQRRRPFR